MEMPQELEIWYVIPAIRRELAKILHEKGIKQNDISEMLNVSKSAVSQYLKEKRAKTLSFSSAIQAEIKKAANEIVKDNKMLMAEVQRICSLIRKSKALCELHKSKYKDLEECNICLR